MARDWTARDVLDLLHGYQPAAVLMAAAELDLFGQLAGREFSAEEAVTCLQTDVNGTAQLLDALAALDLLEKPGPDCYRVPASVADALSADGKGNVLAMAQHQASCLRRWGNLAHVVKTGTAPPAAPSIRGADADYASFVEAMDNISRPAADQVIADLLPLKFEHLLDVGGASGTWTLAFLRAVPGSKATILDLPHVIPQAKARIGAAGLLDRVSFVPGDYMDAPLPKHDLAFLGAIVHSNSREKNRTLLTRLAAALEPGGTILIRDLVMNELRTRPVSGALFAINMLAAGNHGGTFTFDEFVADCTAAGLSDVKIARKSDDMNAVVSARKPK